MRRLSPTAVASLAALAYALSSGAASAEEPVPIDLTWQAPQGCPDRQRVLDEIVRRIGPAPRPIQATAGVFQEDALRWRAHIELSGEVTGTRDLTGESCELVARATALIIALAIDPQAASVLSREIQDAEERQARIPEPEPEPEPVAPPPEPPPEPSPPVIVPERVRAFVLAGVVGELAHVPALAPGGMLGGGLSYAWLRADLSLLIVPLASATIDGRHAADFSVGAVGLRACAVPDLGVVEAGLCAGVRASRIWARGSNVPQTFTRHGDVLALALGPLLRWPSDSDWAGELSFETVVPFNRPDFVIENLGSAYHVPGVGVTGTLALGYRF